jgi:hypothetical protein
MSDFKLYANHRKMHAQKMAYCPHCENDGLVHIDHPDHHGYAAPCPMCAWGRAIDIGQFDGQFWTQREIRNWQWSNGLTARHQRRCRYWRPGMKHKCGRASITDLCDQHTAQAPVSA